MKEILSPISKELLEKELTKERFLRFTRKAGNELYVINHHNAPNVMLEIGRLREIAFRDGGGGTGLEVDIDEYDTMENPYQQLIVWNPDEREILGGYRYILGENVKHLSNGMLGLATAHMFGFSDQFINDFLPHTLELGRSFVTLEYQSTKAGAKGLFALDNLWDGLGALTIVYPQIQYYFGKMTMYPDYPEHGRNMILYFLRRHFPDLDKLVYPLESLSTNTNESEMDKLFTGSTYKENYKILNREVRALGSNIPPLVNAYMGLSPTMRFFGTAINHEFGNVEESGILVVVHEMLEEKRQRHIETYVKNSAMKLA